MFGWESDNNDHEARALLMLAGVGWSWLGLAGVGWSWLELAGVGWSWLELAGVGLVGNG